MEYRKIGWAEMKPDVYGGDDCETHIPEWESYFDGDKDSERIEAMDLDAKCFQPGTRITIKEPVCPDCENIASTCGCGFDWKYWAECEYC